MFLNKDPRTRHISSTISSDAASLHDIHGEAMRYARVPAEEVCKWDQTPRWTLGIAASGME